MPAAQLTSADFKQAVLRKCHESADMKARFFETNADTLETVCAKLAQALSSGHTLFVMGNGGSSCDAVHVAVEFVHPIIEKRRAFPAVALTNDSALLTAIGNDTDFSHTFSEQLKLFGKPGDVALGISTSGKSANVNYGLQIAREMGMLTIGFSGKDGGRAKDIAEYCLNVPSFSIHRIQEVHTTLLHVLWDMVHVMLGEEDII
jgi:D-sedoheptulose 7-phosphate isomerase